MTAAFPEERWSRLGRIAEVSAWGISLLGWGLSYATQVTLASGPGRFHGWEAATFPLTVDLASLAAMVIALDQAKRHQPARAAWLMSILAAGAMMATNIGAEAGHPAAMVLHAWPPAVALMCWGLLTRYRTSLARAHHAEPASTRSTSSTASGNGKTPVARPPNVHRPVHTQQTPTVAMTSGNEHGDSDNGVTDVQQVVHTNGQRLSYEEARAELESEGRRATDKAVGELMGVSEKTVQRHRKKLAAVGNGSVEG